jgi:glycosyltransferase involved in cell wall biosynthesis
VYRPYFLEETISFLEARPSVGLVYRDAALMDTQSSSWKTLGSPSAPAVLMPIVTPKATNTVIDQRSSLHQCSMPSIAGPCERKQRRGRFYAKPQSNRPESAVISRRILYVQFTDPAAYPPVEHSSRLLANRGWDVILLGTGTHGNHNLKMPYHSRIRVNTLRFAKRGWGQKLQYIFFSLWTLYWIWRWKPHWVYASDPLACPVAWLVQKLTNVHILYHEHDSPDLDGGQSWFMKQVFVCRGKVGRDAELCILPQYMRLRHFVETTGRTAPAFCVWNCPLLEEISDPNSDTDRDLIIYYHGSIARSRLPANLIVAASRFKGAIRVRIAGYEVPGSIGYTEELTKLAADHGNAELIEFLGTIPLRRDLLHSASKAHVGLSFMPNQSEDINMQHMVGASNKPFDYMACGLPLLVTDLPEWVSTFVGPGYARACDLNDPDSIEAELRWYLNHPDERREMGRRCREQIRQAWNYETTFAKVLAGLDNSSN